MLQRLRRSTFLARMVLVWFALTLGIAVAAPLLQPVAMELICSGDGASKLIDHGGDGSRPVAGHRLECPLCVSLGAPPILTQVVAGTLSASSVATGGGFTSRVALAAAAPLPARGPPSALN